MELKSPEEGSVAIKGKDQEKGEIIPKEKVQAFGRGLRQMMEEPMDATKKNLVLLEFSSKDDHNKKWKDDVREISNALKAFTKTIFQLENAKQATIVPYADGFNLEFSESTEATDIKEGRLSMDENLAPQFLYALSHKLGTPLGIITGNSSLIASYAGVEALQQQAKELYSSSLEINKILEPLTTNVKRLTIETNEMGNTIITPILDPKRDPIMDPILFNKSLLPFETQKKR